MRRPRPSRRTAAFAVAGALAATLVVVIVFTLIYAATGVGLIRQTQLDGVERMRETRANTETLKILARDNKATMDLVEDCTSPGGECYDRGARRTGEAVGTINQITIYAAACAKQPANVTVRQIQACVEELLAEAD